MSQFHLWNSSFEILFIYSDCLDADLHAWRWGWRAGAGLPKIHVGERAQKRCADQTVPPSHSWAVKTCSCSTPQSQDGCLSNPINSLPGNHPIFWFKMLIYIEKTSACVRICGFKLVYLSLNNTLPAQSDACDTAAVLHFGFGGGWRWAYWTRFLILSIFAICKKTKAHQ